jgi:small-conductance mechanosensitive channel
VVAEGVPVPAVDPVTVGGALVTLLVAYLLARGVSTGLGGLSDRFVEYRITIRMLIPITKFLIYGAAVYYVLGPVLQLSSTQLLAASGLFGAALGFGLQDLFANVIGGLALLVEKPYQVGDKIAVGDHYGEVVDIGLRSTRLLTNDDSTVAVPNYQAITEPVSNANGGNPEMMVVVEFHVVADADLPRAMAIVEDAIATSKYVYVTDERPYVVRAEDEPYYRSIRGKAYVNDLRNEFAFESDVTERVIAAFEEADIERPAPRDRPPAESD